MPRRSTLGRRAKPRGLTRTTEPIVLKHKGLAPAFPSSPTRPPGHVMITKCGTKYDIRTFGATYAAHKYLLELTTGATIKWLTYDRLTTSDGLNIYALGLRDLLRYKPKRAEESWELPEEYVKSADYLRSGQMPPEIVVGASLPTRKRHSRKHLTTLADMIDELKLDPRRARAILRKAHVQKPDHGWAWAPGEELDRIKAMLKR